MKVIRKRKSIDTILYTYAKLNKNTKKLVYEMRLDQSNCHENPINRKPETIMSASSNVIR